MINCGTASTTLIKINSKWIRKRVSLEFTSARGLGLRSDT